MNKSSGTGASSHPRPNSLPTDTVEISDEAQEAIHIDTESNADITIRAKFGDIEAQRLIEQAVAKRKLLGID